MKFRKIVLILSLIVMSKSIYALEDITGVPSSKFENNDNVNIVKIKNLTKENEYIEGSKFQIQDENGFVIFEYDTPKEEYIVKGLTPGKYYLTQVDVPDEYDLNYSKVSFEVIEGINEVQFLNQRSIILPGDMSSNSILLISIAMLNITIIIGVFIYVKKFKNQ